jgi:hypothetical protein
MNTAPGAAELSSSEITEADLDEVNIGAAEVDS